MLAKICFRTSEKVPCGHWTYSGEQCCSYG